jgi:hypothetical protein
MPSRAVKVAEKPRRRAAHESSYERDFYAWSSEQARALRTRRPEKLDWENLAEEIESLGRSDKREVRNRLRVLLVHLLKWQYQTKKRSPSWNGSIDEQRARLEMVLADSPSLRPAVQSLMDQTYAAARRRAGIEMRLSPAEVRELPETSPFTVEQVLDEEFFPD